MVIKALALASLAIIATTVGFYLATSETPTDKTYLARFLAHKQRFGKTFANKEEMEYRYAVFALNMKKIEAHNKTNSSFTMAENKFSTLTFEEFKAKYLSKEVLHNKVKTVNGPIPKGHKDWVKEKKVSRVKDQADCGSCWAFSTTGSLESAYAIFKKKNIEASEQELVDCSGNNGNYGCNGGLMSNAYDYIIANKLSTEKDYVYTAEDGSCQAKKFKTKFTAKSYTTIDPIDVSGLVASIANQPVSVAIEVQDDFMHYHDGIYTNDDCGDALNHGVLAAGYYTDVKQSYFVVKNSWGSDWGADGYIKMAVGKGSGTCGIANGWDVVPTI